MRKLVVWYNPNKKTYYKRIVRGIHYESYEYTEGSVNHYGHIIVLVIPIYNLDAINTPEYTFFLNNYCNKFSSFLNL